MDFFNNKARKPADKAKKDETPALQPWVEKYRPKTLADVTAQGHTTLLLQRTLHAANLPHMLFYGPPGTGKTSTILALSKQLFGPDLFRSRVLELNASDERGIGIVRTKIKDFARQQLSAVPGGQYGQDYLKKYPCPPFKIIVLDEADSMTQDAQSALRRTMETYSRITRFCLVCNYVTRIIDPLASRCSKFRFKSLDTGDAGQRVEDIATAEGVELADGARDALIRCSEGDLRRAITYLQSAAKLVGATEDKQRKKRKDEMQVDARPVTVAIVEEIAGVIPEPIVTTLAAAIFQGAYAAIQDAVTNLVADGWSATQLVGQLYSVILASETVADAAKNRILGVFSETDKRLVDGADEHLTVLDLCLRISGARA